MTTDQKFVHVFFCVCLCMCILSKSIMTLHFNQIRVIFLLFLSADTTCLLLLNLLILPFLRKDNKLELDA